MRSLLLLKIVLVLGYIYLSIHVFSHNYPIEQSIQEQYAAQASYKNDPALDSATNRKRYAQNKLSVEKQLTILNERKYASWYKMVLMVLAPFVGWLIRNIVTTLYKRRSK
jgi:hypothetical protein